MRTRILWMAAALLLLALPAVADAPAAVEEGEASEAAVETPRMEGEPESLEAGAPWANVVRGCSLEALLDQPVEQSGLCPICPLSFCEEPGVRCDYVSCNSLCCKYRCFRDASCTSGSCFSSACHC